MMSIIITPKITSIFVSLLVHFFTVTAIKKWINTFFEEEKVIKKQFDDITEIVKERL